MRPAMTRPRRADCKRRPRSQWARALECFRIKCAAVFRKDARRNKELGSFRALTKIGTTLAFAVAISTLGVAVANAKTFNEMFPGAEVKAEAARTLLEAMDFQQGSVKIGAGGVTLDIPPKYYFLGPADARRALVDIWGNPPSVADGVLGMLFPAIKMPVEKTWGAVVTFADDGYVSDADAEKIDYAEMLKSMQESTDASNAEREKAGFGRIRLVGWAAQPYYDAATKKLHWAKELEFGGRPNHTLNYAVRALGRRGVLEVNFVSGIDDLPVIRAVIPDVLEMAQFEQGSRYSDFIPGADKVAAYGIGGLIAGKLLAKVGFLALALVFLKKGGVLLLLGVGAAVRYVAGLVRRKP